MKGFSGAKVKVGKGQETKSTQVKPGKSVKVKANKDFKGAKVKSGAR